MYATGFPEVEENLEMKKKNSGIRRYKTLHYSANQLHSKHKIICRTFVDIYTYKSIEKSILINIYFDDEPKEEQSCISAFPGYLAIPRSNQEYQPRHHPPRRKKLHRTNQGSNFLGGSFSNRDNKRAQIR